MLNERIELLKKEHKKRSERRERWEHYRKIHAKNAKITNYEEWDMYEPEIDMSDFQSEDYVPDIPEMKSMYIDMLERTKKRNAEIKAASKVLCVY